MTKKIYVASSWRNPYQPGVVTLLREMGHTVYDFRNEESHFKWEYIDKEWEEWDSHQYRKALLHPLAEKGFKSDFNAMKWADVCVLVLPCGRSANAEAGWMKGAGKKVWVYQPIPQEPELMYKMHDGILISLNEIKKVFI